MTAIQIYNFFALVKSFLQGQTDGEGRWRARGQLVFPKNIFYKLQNFENILIGSQCKKI
jgi:hypothetical protein